MHIIAEPQYTEDRQQYLDYLEIYGLTEAEFTYADWCNEVR